MERCIISWGRERGGGGAEALEDFSLPPFLEVPNTNTTKYHELSHPCWELPSTEEVIFAGIAIRGRLPLGWEGNQVHTNTLGAPASDKLNEFMA